MATHRFAQFELDSWPDLAKTVLGATSLIGVGEPILSGLAKTIPRAALQRVVRAWATATIRIADLFGRHLLPVVITGAPQGLGAPVHRPTRVWANGVNGRSPAVPIGDAKASMRETERKMKQLAFSPATAAPRRSDPTRDGFWDGYRYEIDADFPELASLVEAHRRR